MPSSESARLAPPLLQPLGDRGLLVRFATSLSDAANLSAVAFAQRLQEDPPAGVVEIDPNLVSVLLRYDAAVTSFETLAGEVRLRLATIAPRPLINRKQHRIPVRFGGECGADLGEVATRLGLSPSEFIERHNARPLRVLTIGFAPGFVYCGFHPEDLVLPRRIGVRAAVPPGTLLFAAGQTAITATELPTGWHVIGRTDLRSFDVHRVPPTVFAAGDAIVFEAAP